MIRRDPTVLESIISSQLTLSAFLICTFTSIVLGVGIALVGMYRSRSSQSYAVALAILPVVVQLVIMLVNGNVGAGVAVAGAFSLVRFRSVPGTAREIGVLFMAMAVGLATGMGYVGLAVIFFNAFTVIFVSSFVRCFNLVIQSGLLSSTARIPLALSKRLRAIFKPPISLSGSSNIFR